MRSSDAFATYALARRSAKAEPISPGSESFHTEITFPLPLSAHFPYTGLKKAREYWYITGMSDPRAFMADTGYEGVLWKSNTMKPN